MCMCGTDGERGKERVIAVSERPKLVITARHAHRRALKNPDYLVSVESSRTAMPLWLLFFPVGSLWVSQWRPLESLLL